MMLRGTNNGPVRILWAICRILDRKEHKECNQQHQQGESKIISLARDAGSNGRDLQQFEAKIERVAAESFHNKQSLKSLVAIGVQRDATSAKDQTFATGDGWFTYNLISNLAQM